MIYFFGSSKKGTPYSNEATKRIHNIYDVIDLTYALSYGTEPHAHTQAHHTLHLTKLKNGSMEIRIKSRPIGGKQAPQI